MHGGLSIATVDGSVIRLAPVKVGSPSHYLQVVIEMLYTPRKTSMTMERQPFEDVSPIKNGDVPLAC